MISENEGNSKTKQKHYIPSEKVENQFSYLVYFQICERKESYLLLDVGKDCCSTATSCFLKEDFRYLPKIYGYNKKFIWRFSA